MVEWCSLRQIVVLAAGGGAWKNDRIPFLNRSPHCSKELRKRIVDGERAPDFFCEPATMRRRLGSARTKRENYSRAQCRAGRVGDGKAAVMPVAIETCWPSTTYDCRP